MLVSGPAKATALRGDARGRAGARLPGVAAARPSPADRDLRHRRGGAAAAAEELVERPRPDRARATASPASAPSTGSPTSLVRACDAPSASAGVTRRGRSSSPATPRPAGSRRPSRWKRSGRSRTCRRCSRMPAATPRRTPRARFPIIRAIGEIRRVTVVTSSWHLRAPYFFAPYRVFGLRLSFRFDSAWKLAAHAVARAAEPAGDAAGAPPGDGRDAASSRGGVAARGRARAGRRPGLSLLLARAPRPRRRARGRVGGDRRGADRRRRQRAAATTAGRAPRRNRRARTVRPPGERGRRPRGDGRGRGARRDRRDPARARRDELPADDRLDGRRDGRTVASRSWRSGPPTLPRPWPESIWKARSSVARTPECTRRDRLRSPADGVPAYFSSDGGPARHARAGAARGARPDRGAARPRRGGLAGPLGRIGGGRPARPRRRRGPRHPRVQRHGAAPSPSARPRGGGARGRPPAGRRHRRRAARGSARARARPAGGGPRVVLVSDATPAAAAPPGSYRLAGVEIESTDVRRACEPRKAASRAATLTLDAAVRNWASMTEASLAEAIAAAERGARGGARTHRGPSPGMRRRHRPAR